MNFNDLKNATANSVVYSEAAWAAARKSSSGADTWFVDPGAWRSEGGMTSEQLFDWTNDWEKLR